MQVRELASHRRSDITRYCRLATVLAAIPMIISISGLFLPLNNERRRERGLSGTICTAIGRSHFGTRLRTSRKAQESLALATDR